MLSAARFAAGSGSTKFSVEVPVADSSAAGTLALARDIIQVCSRGRGRCPAATF